MEMQKDLVVGGVELKWDLTTGQVLFEGGDVVFFWVSAMKTFFDTINEITGEEATNLVLEATGFRQGIIVGEGFKEMKEINTSNVVAWLSDTYVPAGWGYVRVEKMEVDTKNFTLYIKDDWEYKMNKLGAQEKQGIFVPAHYAGVFTGLFGRNFWYKIVEYQNDSNPFTVVEYFPSDMNVQQSIWQMARRQEAKQIQQLENLVAEKTKMLQDLVKELSSPLIPVLDGIVVVPLIGRYDEDRAEDLIMNTLNNLPKYQARYVLLDLTGLNKEISPYTAELIEKLGSAARLLGVEVILVGISAELAMVITETLTGLRKYECLQTLQHGIYYALGKSGRRIV
ncbi:STAS domain-containing protein [Mesobacillus selenatarsenatis]|uniref:RsbR, positive regulator of sigma-B n=1 Tax=Mesobacillus selenatarsenatis (strain DSM 18680 / JCM 14380 / FERM P-15431 / SF-1) TaxID=1321606 RepID=A0A0A8WXV4_MESS1|nr:STAS domain-containing protein [Mesobacillus selenatarsenatis]GAM12453.1 RsbR, positive regulator of sigma-B [Mesobacillus selenatarsenatis SF-1]